MAIDVNIFPDTHSYLEEKSGRYTIDEIATACIRYCSYRYKDSISSSFLLILSNTEDISLGDYPCISVELDQDTNEFINSLMLNHKTKMKENVLLCCIEEVYKKDYSDLIYELIDYLPQKDEMV